MKYLLLSLLLLSNPAISVVDTKHDPALCRAIESDNYVVVMSKLKKDASKTFDDAYKEYRCSGKTLLQVAKPKTYRRLLNNLDYLTVRDEEKYAKTN